MDESIKYDNWFSNGVTALIGTLVRTFERSIVLFWDGLKNATVHGTPSLLGFVAAVAPVMAPLYTAIQTARSLTEFLQQPVYQAIIGAIALEFIGFELWVFLTEILINSKWTGGRIQYALAGGVVVYELALILINVILLVMKSADATGAFIAAHAILMFFWCLMPALAAIGYGWQNAQNKALLESERVAQLEMAERVRQEKRQDRKEAQALKMQEKLSEKSFRK